jgi:hypothetical protein
MAASGTAISEDALSARALCAGIVIPKASWKKLSEGVARDEAPAVIESASPGDIGVPGSD